MCQCPVYSSILQLVFGFYVFPEERVLCHTIQNMLALYIQGRSRPHPRHIAPDPERAASRDHEGAHPIGHLNCIGHR